jgi:hypothetical protein
MINKPLDAITASELELLVTERVAEDLTLEYKAVFKRSTDSEKHEFLADVSSFANARGGDIVYGIEAKEGVPQKIVGLAGITEKDIIGAESSLRTGLRPQIPDVRVRQVDTPAGSVLICRVSPSWAMPHMVIFNGSFRFYVRVGRNKDLMDVDALRAAFSRGDRIKNHARSFRQQRLAALLNGTSPIQMAPGPLVIVQVIPWATSLEDRILTSEEMARFRGKLLTMAGGGDFYWNFDGLLISAGKSEGRTIAYSQVFRDGTMESADTMGIGHKGLLHASAVEGRVVQIIRQYVAGAKLARIEPPFWILVSVLHLRGYATGYSMRPQVIDRDHLLLPEVLYNDPAADVGMTMQPAFDALWQAGGFEGSPSYADGSWQPPK